MRVYISMRRGSTDMNASRISSEDCVSSFTSGIVCSNGDSREARCSCERGYREASATMTLPARIAAPKRLDAEVFHRAMRAGRNRALLLGARGDDGELIDCVVKLPGLMENTVLHPLPSLLEWLGAALAAELGVSSPRPHEVIITSGFADGIREERIRAGVARSTGSVFGSGFIHGTPMVAGDLIEASLRAPAAALVAFDVFIHNIDRRADNPNLFLSRAGFIAFDHGDAFAFLFPLIGAPDPVMDPLLSILEKHALASCVRRRGEPDLGEFVLDSSP